MGQSLLLALLLWQNAVSATPAPVVSVVDLPEEPKAHYDFLSRIAVTGSTQRFGGKQGRLYGGTVTFQASPQLLIGAGYAGKGWDAIVTVRPFAKRKQDEK